MNQEKIQVDAWQKIYGEAQLERIFLCVFVVL